LILDKNYHRLFVEGQSDAAVVNKLVLRRLGLDLAQNRIVSTGDRDEGGFEWVRGQLEAALVTKKLVRFGAVVDRDAVSGKPDRWLSMRSLLSSHDVDIDAPPATGMLATTAWGARIGLWVMPDNVSAGDLETFLESLVPTESRDWAWAGEATTRAKTEGAEFRDVHARKARLNTWLAWRDPPGNPYGTAIEATQLRDSSPVVDTFVDWFKRLFIDP